ncbi:hypothetical protein RSOL_027700, partial [Rhizoctonia solani AG-3 Rhs1AP]
MPGRHCVLDTLGSARYPRIDQVFARISGEIGAVKWAPKPDPLHSAAEFQTPAVRSTFVDARRSHRLFGSDSNLSIMVLVLPAPERKVADIAMILVNSHPDLTKPLARTGDAFGHGSDLDSCDRANLLARTGDAFGHGSNLDSRQVVLILAMALLPPVDFSSAD